MVELWLPLLNIFILCREPLQALPYGILLEEQNFVPNFCQKFCREIFSSRRFPYDKAYSVQVSFYHVTIDCKTTVVLVRLPAEVGATETYLYHPHGSRSRNHRTQKFLYSQHPMHPSAISSDKSSKLNFLTHTYIFSSFILYFMTSSAQKTLLTAFEPSKESFGVPDLRTVCNRFYWPINWMVLAGDREQGLSVQHFNVNFSLKTSLKKKESPTPQVYLRSPLIFRVNKTVSRRRYYATHFLR